MPDLTVDVDEGETSPTGDPGGVTVENLVVVNSTTITCDLVISQTAAAGNRYLRVTHTGGSDSNNLAFMTGYPSDFLVFFG